jgi:hypothetical protein
MTTRPEYDPSAWRLTPVGDLGLGAGTLAVLEMGEITTAGDLVETVAGPPGWLSTPLLADIDEALTRLRCRLSNAGVEDYDLARWGEGGAFAGEAVRASGAAQDESAGRRRDSVARDSDGLASGLVARGMERPEGDGDDEDEGRKA